MKFRHIRHNILIRYSFGECRLVIAPVCNCSGPHAPPDPPRHAYEEPPIRCESVDRLQVPAFVRRHPCEMGKRSAIHVSHVFTCVPLRALAESTLSPTAPASYLKCWLKRKVTRTVDWDYRIPKIIRESSPVMWQVLYQEPCFAPSQYKSPRVAVVWRRCKLPGVSVKKNRRLL